MKVRFLGPIDRVTGSCTWLRAPERKFNALVDCGLIQGETGALAWNEGEFPFEPQELTHVFLTHAHIDHCGLIPLLYRRGYTGTVYCTKETAELARLVLHDSVTHGAPYTAADVEAIRFHEPALDRARNGFAPVHDEVFLKWYRSGHIYGAVSMTLYVGPPGSPKQRTILFSGDLGGVEDGREQLTLNRFRESPFAADVAVIESTYGDRTRTEEEDDGERRLERLEEELRRVADGGVLILPAFAIDRTQQVLLDVHEVLRRDAIRDRRLAGLSLRLHASLATKVNAVYARGATRKFTSHNGKTRPVWLGKALFDQLGLDPHDAEHERAAEAWVRLSLGEPETPGDESLLRRYIPGAERRLSIEATTLEAGALAAGTVLVTGGGMCDGGPVHAYLAANLQRPEVTVGFTGFLSGGTIGARLFALAGVEDRDRGRLSETVRLSTGPNSVVDFPLSAVRARFVRLGGYSGHADQNSLVRWVFKPMQREQRPAGRRVLVQHGQPHARRALAGVLNEEARRLGVESFQAETPNDIDWYDLETGSWDTSESRRRQREALLRRIAELDQAEASGG